MKKVFSVFLFIIFAQTGFPQIVLNNSSTYPILPGAQAMGMGFAYTAMMENNTSIFWNPGAIPGLLTHQFTVSGYAFQTPEMPQAYLAPGFLGLTVITRRYGTWSLGAYNLYADTSYRAISFSWGYRYNRWVKMGFAIGYRPLFTPNEQFDANRLLFSAGILFQPNPYIRLGYLLQSLPHSIRFVNSPYDTLSLWRQNRIGLALQPIPFITLATDFDFYRGTQHLGLRLRFGPEFTLRLGAIAPNLYSHLRNKNWQALRYTAGITLGEPGLTISAVQLNNQDFFFNLQLQFNFGRPRRAYSVRTQYIQYSIPTYSGIYIHQTPNPLTLLPPQIKQRVNTPEQVETFLNSNLPIIDTVYTEVPGTQTYMEYTPPRPLPGSELTITIKQWPEYSPRESNIALQYLQKAITMAPRFAPAYQQMGLLYLGLRFYQTAYYYLQQAYRLSAFNAGPFIGIALYAIATGDNNLLKQWLSQSKQYSNTSGFMPIAQSYAAANLGNISTAISYWNSSSQAHSNLPLIHFYRGYLYFIQGKVPLARKLWGEHYTNANTHHPAFQLISLFLQYQQSVSHPYLITNSQSNIVLAAAGATSSYRPTVFDSMPMDSIFSANVGRVYIWLKLKNIPQEGVRIVPVWHWENQIVFTGKRGWRVGPSGLTYGYKTIHSYQTGLWRVDFYIKNTKQYIGSVYFQVKEQEEIS